MVCCAVTRFSVWKMDLSKNLNLQGAVVASPTHHSLDADYLDESFSALGNASLRFKKDDKCFICKEKFSRLRGNPRHHCRLCSQSVCGPHSATRWPSQGGDEPLRVCDECFEHAVMTQHRADFQAELDLVNTAIIQAEKEIARTSRQEASSEALVRSAEAELMLFTSNSEIMMNDLQTRMARAEAEGARLRATLDRVKREIEEANTNEHLKAKAVRENDAKLSHLTKDLQETREVNQELTDQLEHGVTSMKNSLDISVATAVFCWSCINKVCSAQQINSNTNTLSIISQGNESIGDFMPDVSGIPFESILESKVGSMLLPDM